MKSNEINQLEKILNVKFSNKILLKQAFTHKSKSINISINNERLEFLGDRVLGLVIASYLTAWPPPHGIQKILKIDQFLNLSKAQKQNYVGKRKILGDLCESIIGAVFMDKGFDQTKKFILRIWSEKLKKTENVIIDPKTRLQEFSLKLYKKLPEYKYLSNTGPSHRPKFKVSVSIEKTKGFIAYGSSKKNAETNAAKKLLEHLKIQ